MTKTSLLLLGTLAILALLFVVGFALLPKEQPMPQVESPLPTSSQPTSPQTPTSTIQPSPDPTATWKTYRNEKYGFEVKYPPSYVFEEKPTNREENHVSFWSEEDLKWKQARIEPSFEIVSEQTSPSMSLKDWMDQKGCISIEGEADNEVATECKFRPVSINGLEYLYTHEAGHGEGIWHYMIKQGSTVLDFQVYQSEVLKQAEFLQVLGSLKWEE